MRFDQINANKLSVCLENTAFSLRQLSKITGVSAVVLSKLKNRTIQHIQITTAHKLALVLGTISEDDLITIGSCKLQKINPYSFGAFMRSCRQVCLLSQEEFIDYYGLPKTFVTAAENNKIGLIQYEQLEEIASVFNCVARDIMHYDPADEIKLTKNAIREFLKKRLKSHVEINRFKANSGISRDVLAYYLSGSHMPFKKQIRKICNFFSCCAFEIIKYDPDFDHNKQRCKGFKKLSQVNFRAIEPEHLHP